MKPMQKHWNAQTQMVMRRKERQRKSLRKLAQKQRAKVRALEHEDDETRKRMPANFQRMASQRTVTVVCSARADQVSTLEE